MLRTTTQRLAVPLLAVLFSFAAPARAAETKVLLRNFLGTVDISPGNRGDWLPARPAVALQVGDAVRTGADGSALLVHGLSELFIKSGTTAVVGYQSVQLRQGALWFRMRKTPEGFKFITDVAAATIRGTMGLIHTTGEVTTVSLLRGKVEIDTVNRENYMLLPQREIVARRNRPLEKTAMSGTRTTDLVSEFFSTAKRLGTAGQPAPGNGSNGAPSGSGRAPGDELLKKGTGLYDPAANRLATTASGALNAATNAATSASSPLITITGSPVMQAIGTSTGTVISSVGSTPNNVVNTVGHTVNGVNNTVIPAVSPVVTPIVNGVTGGTATVVNGVTGGVGAGLGGVGGLGGVTGGAGQALGGVAGGTGPALGGVPGGVGGLLGGLGGTAGGSGTPAGGLLGGLRR